MKFFEEKRNEQKKYMRKICENLTTFFVFLSRFFFILTK